VKTIIAWLLELFGIGTSPGQPTRHLRLRITRPLLHALYRATSPTATTGEPLAFLCTRFASEHVTDVIVAVDVLPFPPTAYVNGFAGANFDTDWAIQCANESARSNGGIFLAHQHGWFSKPDFSSVDRHTNMTVMAPLSYGMPTIPYGAIVLSDTDARIVVAVNGSLIEAQLEIVADALGGFEVTV
jgi:hypothetical protein